MDLFWVVVSGGGYFLGGGGSWWVEVDGGMVYISPSHIALHCYN